MNLFTKQKQTHKHRKQTCGYQRGKEGNKDTDGENGLGDAGSGKGKLG